MNSTTDNPTLQAALQYAERGLHSFPVHSIGADGKCTCGKEACERPAKHPRTQKGLKDATTSKDFILKWGGRWLASNIGIATGGLSGLFTLDVDGPEGEQSLEDLENQCGKLPLTWEHRTGNGRQIHFRYPKGATIRNSAKKIAPGLDVRGEGGYGIWPPSRHYTGRMYEWIHAPEKTALANPPAWLLNRLTESPQSRQKSKTDSNGHSSLSDILAGVPEGQRDEQLFKYACSRRAKGMSQAEVETLVLTAARACSPPLDEKTALEKVRSAFRYETKTSKPGEAVNLTDMGNAQRLVRLFGDRIRFCKALGWLIYDGKKWVADDESQVQRFAKDTVKHLYIEAAEEADEDQRKALAKFAMKCESASRIQAMLALLASEPGVSVSRDVFDTDKMLLNVANGTIDLRTGAIRPHSSDDLLTKIASVEYSAGVECPRWEQFIREIMDGNPELVSFLQRLLGYTLTGETIEEVWALLWGGGSNGKTTLLFVLTHILGDYAINTPPATFMEKKFDSGGVSNDIARLRGARLITASEPKKGKFDTELLKRFMGRDPISARFLHKEFFEFLPSGKVFFSANHRPDVRDTSDGFWRRVLLIPFVRQFAGDAKDNRLAEKLQSEAPGILAWMVHGCLEWQATGLQVPEIVQVAVNDYRKETDVLADFIEARCTIRPGASITVRDLTERYNSYCDEHKINRRMTRQQFNDDMLGRPGITRERIGKSKVHTWLGIGCIDANPQQKSCSICNLEGEPCRELIGSKTKDAAQCAYYEAYQ